jgi:hypothetical protein
VIGREVELRTYDEQHANTVLSALMLCVAAVVYPLDMPEDQGSTVWRQLDQTDPTMLFVVAVGISAPC